jgi:hypothetical protein
MHRAISRRKVKVYASAITLIAAIFVAWMATGFTGAYFTDTHSGNITGTLGSIRVTPSGGSGTENMDLQFTNLLPGEPQTVSVNYQNTGTSTEDVWIKFQNPTALSALNNLGTYGEVHVVANGTSLFDSANLNDRLATCGAFSTSGCWPLPAKLKVASGVGPTASGTINFTFGYASKMKTQPPAGTQWNTFPASSCAYAPGSCPDGQTTINVADGTGSGLPYQIVATQVNQTP